MPAFLYLYTGTSHHKHQLKILLSIAFTLALAVTLHGCAPFAKGPKGTIENPATVSQLNGTYKISALPDSLRNTDDIEQHNAFEKFYRGRGRGSRDTMKISQPEQYSFTLSIVSKSNIQITYLHNNNPFKTLRFAYQLKNDGWLYLNNRNVKWQGIPYLFGGFDIKKLRLASINNELVIEEVYHSSGAVLLVFGDAKTWRCRHRYKRVL
jgi:hypothetical protein